MSGGDQGILQETIAGIQAVLGEKLDEIEVERVVIGLFFTGIKLNNGDGGLCFTPIKTIPQAVCCPSSARAMPSSGKFKGKKVKKVLEEMFSGNSLKKAIGIAAINALSSTCWGISPPRDYVIKQRVDPVDEIEIPGDAEVVIVGALAPYIKMFKKRGQSFTILEIDPATLKADEMKFFRPAQDAPEIVPQADVLIITGTTLINDTLDQLLSLAKPGAVVIVVGPTASMLPEAFFQRGVTSIGGVAVTEPDGLLDIISEAGSGYHFFEKSAERVVISRTRRKGDSKH